MIEYHRRWVEPERYLQRWLDPRLGSIRVADITSYLVHRGWEPVRPDRPNTLVFREPADSAEERLYQFVPDSEALPDYRRRLIELITLLAFYENRYAPDIVDDMLVEAKHGKPNGALPSPADQESKETPGIARA